MRKRLRDLIYFAAVSALVSHAFAGLPNAPKPNSQSPPTVQYEISLNSKRYGNKGTASFKMKGDKMCWERKTGGGMWLLLIKNDDGLFLVDKLTKRIGRYPPDSPRNSPRRLIPGPIGDPREFLKTVQAEKNDKANENGKQCDTWSYVEPETKWHCKLYIDRKSKRPVKLIMAGATEKSDTVTVTYTSFKTGVTIDDSVFKLPEAYPIRDMPKPGSSKMRKRDDQTRPKVKEERRDAAGPEAGYAPKNSGDAQCKPPPQDQEQKGQSDGEKS